MKMMTKLFGTRIKEVEKEYKRLKEKIGDRVLSYDIRSDGRVELLCKCGVGHPSQKLTEMYRGHWNDYDAMHGCCGCCEVLFSSLED